MDIKSYSGFKEAFYGLENNEVDIVVTPKSTGRFIIHKEGLKDMRTRGEIEYIRGYYFRKITQ